MAKDRFVPRSTDTDPCPPARLPANPATRPRRETERSGKANRELTCGGDCHLHLIDVARAIRLPFQVGI